MSIAGIYVTASVHRDPEAQTQQPRPCAELKQIVTHTKQNPTTGA